ncbi:hypothetical protein C427_1752 [Paraglaciecola psychrophila 170]|uniref:Uncharacterized protein n=2 Tax=Paraglaciecola TaxID=1621534 RepID=M4RJV0_9ALTE|nr:hypothetical protein C427_1752 [Paraglaciecola psychrophila 170]
MFRFHIMDYGDAEDIDNWLLFVVTFFAILGGGVGLVMTLFLVIKPFKKKPYPIRISHEVSSNEVG